MCIRDRRHTKISAWFNFIDLISPPRCFKDFVSLAKTYKSIFIENVRPLKETENNQLINFCHLIDVCYEKKIKVIILSSCDIKQIFNNHLNKPPTKRTISRLKELQK